MFLRTEHYYNNSAQANWLLLQIHTDYKHCQFHRQTLPHNLPPALGTVTSSASALILLRLELLASDPSLLRSQPHFRSETPVRVWLHQHMSRQIQHTTLFYYNMCLRLTRFDRLRYTELLVPGWILLPEHTELWKGLVLEFWLE